MVNVWGCVVMSACVVMVVVVFSDDSGYFTCPVSCGGVWL